MQTVGGTLVAISVAGSIVAYLSRERWITFLVLVCLSASTLTLAQLTRSHASSWNDEMEEGRAARFELTDEARYEYGGTPGEWARMRGAERRVASPGEEAARSRPSVR